LRSPRRDRNDTFRDRPRRAGVGIRESTFLGSARIENAGFFSLRDEVPSPACSLVLMISRAMRHEERSRRQRGIEPAVGGRNIPFLQSCFHIIAAA
jgi:hypothetical protein